MKIRSRRHFWPQLLFVAALGLASLLAPGAAQAQFQFVTKNGSITITGYSGPGGTVAIPAATNGLPVTAIGDNAFNQCGAFTGVTVPGSVTDIGAYAFNGCTNLVSLTLSNGLVSIGDWAFCNCGFTNLSFPSTVTTVRCTAFNNCSGLTRVVIPRGLVNLIFGLAPFYGCTSLTNITVDPNNPVVASDTNGVLYFKDFTYLYECPEGRTGSYIIPTNVTHIATEAFAVCRYLTNVTIPNGVVAIGSEAFGDCHNLAELTIPDSVTDIGDASFMDCFHLTSVTLSSNITTIADGLFLDCPALTSVTIPAGVTSIAYNAFNECTGLTNVAIPGGVTSIGGWAFASCSSLESITIPSGVTNIGSYGFFDCANLTNILFQGNAPAADNTAFLGDSGTVYYLPGATGWGSTFAGLPVVLKYQASPAAQFLFATNDGSITITGYTGPGGTVVVPNTINGYPVTSIANYAFSGEQLGPPVVLPPVLQPPVIQPPVIQPPVVRNLVARNASPLSITNVTVPGSVTNIGFGAFLGCTKLINVTLLNGVVSIGNSAFYGCTGLPRVTIPASVTDIGTAAFGQCPKLAAIAVDTNNAAYSSVNGVLFDKGRAILEEYPGGKTGTYTIPGSVKFIADAAFESCAQLTGVTIPNTVTAIGPNGFAGCTSLPHVIIPDSVTGLGEYAFLGCHDLVDVTIGRGVTNIASGLWGSAFAGCTKLIDINVDEHNKKYSSTKGVLFSKDRTTLVEFPAGQRGIYTIPSGVTSVGAAAFFDCSLLNGINIPSSAKSLGAEAFMGCAGLTSIMLPNNVTSVGSFTFDDCSRLERVTIGSGVTNLLAGAAYVYGSDNIFPGCPKLISITVDSRNPAYSSTEGVLFDKHKTTLLRYPSGLIGSYAIPNTVKTVGACAFQDCTGLSGIIIAAGVTNLAEQAFEGCTRLKTVTIPNGVISIGFEAFADCTGLTSISFGTAVADLGAAALDGCTNLTGLYFSGNAPADLYFDFQPQNVSATIYYLAGTSGWNFNYPIGLPAVMLHAPNPSGSLQGIITPAAAANSGAQWQVDGGLIQPSSATVLGLSVGKHTVSFTPLAGWITPSNQIVLVNSNTVVSATGNYIATGSMAFICTTNSDNTLTIVQYVGQGGGVTIPTTINGLRVAAIGNDAFLSCASLTNVLIPYGVKNIGSWAFRGTRLTTLTIPGSVTNIGDHAFEFCSALASLTLSNGITSLGDNAFCDCFELASLVIPDSTTSVGSRAFFYCNALTNITIPSSLTNIGFQAFSDCMSLTNITVEALNPAYASVAGVLFDKNVTTLIQYPCGLKGSYDVPGTVASIEDGAFEYCNSLSGVTVPNSVTNIGNQAFAYCGGLAGVAIPNGVIRVGDQAFEYCFGLRQMTISASVTSIGEGMCSGCWQMTNITVDLLNPDYASAGGVLFDKTFSTLMQYPDGTRGSYDVPDGVTVIASQAFEDCRGLTGVTIPGSVTAIREAAFYECGQMTNLTLASGLVSIGGEAFQNCQSLTSVVLPGSVASIGDWAFGYCTSLANATIPGSVTNLGYGAFVGCISLTNLTILNGATMIGADAFDGDTGLESIKIPGSVTNVGSRAWADCTNLVRIYWAGNAPVAPSGIYDWNPFYNDPATIYYLPGTTGWSNTVAGLPTAPWFPPNPTIVNSGFGADPQGKRFGFTIAWATKAPVVVEACTNLANPVWLPVQTNAPGNGTVYFSEAPWTNCPGRFYRVRQP